MSSVLIGALISLSTHVPAYFLDGDVAEVAFWQGFATFGQTEFDSIRTGTLPETIQPSFLVEHLTLLTQGATQVGTKGNVFTNGASTTQGATHPITRTADTTAPTISSPTGASSGTTTATGSVTTDEANGTLYWMATTNATETAATVKGGSSQAVTATGVQNVTVSGLTASTAYYLHFLHRDAAGNDSTVVNSAQFTTSAPGDTTPPALSSPSAVQSGATTANGFVTTDEANGALYRYASTNATETAATVKAANLFQSVTATGVQSVNFTGLSPSTVYYAHYVHRDAAGNDSTVANSAQFTTPAAPDTTAPTLSSPTATKTGSTTASWSVTTNEANGSLFVYFSVNASEPVSTILSSGASQAVTATGAQSGTKTGLTASTTYYGHFAHTDTAGNTATSGTHTAAFTTDPAAVQPTFTPAITGKNINGGARASVPCRVAVYDKATDALVGIKTGLTSTSSGLPPPFQLTSGAVAGTEYLCKAVATADNKDLGFFWCTPA